MKGWLMTIRVNSRLWCYRLWLKVIRNAVWPRHRLVEAELRTDAALQARPTVLARNGGKTAIPILGVAKMILTSRCARARSPCSVRRTTRVSSTSWRLCAECAATRNKEAAMRVKPTHRARAASRPG